MNRIFSVGVLLFVVVMTFSCRHKESNSSTLNEQLVEESIEVSSALREYEYLETGILKPDDFRYMMTDVHDKNPLDMVHDTKGCQLKPGARVQEFLVRDDGIENSLPFAKNFASICVYSMEDFSKMKITLVHGSSANAIGTMMVQKVRQRFGDKIIERFRYEIFADTQTGDSSMAEKIAEIDPVTATDAQLGYLITLRKRPLRVIPRGQWERELNKLGFDSHLLMFKGTDLNANILHNNEPYYMVVPEKIVKNKQLQAKWDPQIKKALSKNRVVMKVTNDKVWNGKNWRIFQINPLFPTSRLGFTLIAFLESFHDYLAKIKAQKENKGIKTKENSESAETKD